MRRALSRLLAVAGLAAVALAGDRPLGLDLYLPVPGDNPLTTEKAALGSLLFREKLLSRDSSTSCADCHRPDLAFTDGRAKSVGVYGRVGMRSVPTLVNRAWGESFVWDGRLASMEEQVLQPILANSFCAAGTGAVVNQPGSWA